MNRTTAQGIVLMLQTDPLYYRSFGPYWWPVKAELLRQGFTHENLAGLGKATEAAATGWFKGRDRDEVLAEAVDYQLERQGDPYDVDHETPEGDPYRLHDQDVE